MNEDIEWDLAGLPAGHFSAIEADPPWLHRSWSPNGQTKRSPSHHYPVMALKDIIALGPAVKRVAAPNSHLFLWTTQPHLEESFQVMKAWGYKYSSVHTFWVKLNKNAVDEIWIGNHALWGGMGLTTRKNVEMILLGRRGSPKRLVKNMPDTIFACRREHSRKPDVAFDRIVRYCPGPRLQMFGRESREGFTTLGNEATKFDREAA